MDLKNLLGPSTNSVDANKQTQNPNANRPDPKRHNSTINYLVNQDNTNLASSSPVQGSMKSPILASKTPSSVVATPTGNAAQMIKARSSISSLTNDTDVDVDGKETPSIARRLSYEFSNSESNSPVLPKKTIHRQASVQDIMNVDEETSKIKDDISKVKQDGISLKKEVPSKKFERDIKSVKSSPKSKPNKKLEDELETLKRLEQDEEKINQENKGKKRKPKRYSKPPIWATKWIPTAKVNSNKQSSSNNNNNNQSSDSDLKVSITGIKPYNDVTRSVANWIYAQLQTVSKEDRPYLELEVKFGKIWGKASDRRISIPVRNECIIDQGYMQDFIFKAGLDKAHFEKINNYLLGLTKLRSRDFQIFKTDQVDKQYREASKNEIPKFYRLTFDKATKRIVANIEKRKLASLFIHSPNSLYDYRLTLSIELESKQNPEKFENQTPETERHKRRTSVINNDTATRFDITDVSQKTKTSKATVETKEVELEIDMIKLVDAFDRLDEDPFTFEKLSETLMDNSRILNREL